MTSIEPRARRSLSHVGGAITTGGDPALARALAGALDVAPAGELADEPERADVHGFHAYPARMHPLTAARLVAGLTREGDLVLDPFAGSGTVLVEAVAAGRRAVGTDLNPLAIELARMKVRPFSPRDLEALVAEAYRVREVADDRRKARAGAAERFPREDVELFDPHVLLELGSLRAAIQVAPPALRSPLRLVLSSLLVKVSRKRGDTSAELAPRRLAAGYAAKLFARKTEELASRLAAYAARCPIERPRARVVLDDATSLETVETASVDAVITSPPYVATYDYTEHHALRARWLGLRASRLAERELGARRTYARRTADEARSAWLDELRALLAALARVVRGGGTVTLLMADSAVADQALRADELVAEACLTVTELAPLARASQERPHFHGPTARAFRHDPRREHALLLRRASKPRARRL